MPFKSQAQRGWMYANEPEMAKRWEKHTPKGKLPKHVDECNVDGTPSMSQVFSSSETEVGKEKPKSGTSRLKDVFSIKETQTNTSVLKTAAAKSKPLSKAAAIQTAKAVAKNTQTTIGQLGSMPGTTLATTTPTAQQPLSMTLAKNPKTGTKVIDPGTGTAVSIPGLEGQDSPTPTQGTTGVMGTTGQ